MYNNDVARNGIGDDAVSKIFSRVFAWMFMGLMITAVSAYVVSETTLINVVFSNPVLWIFFVVAELVLVSVLSWRINKLSVPTARMMFIVYSLVNGITLSCIFAVYSLPSIFSTFLITAILFLLMAIAGAVTKIDLTKYSSLFFFGLIGIIVSSLINMLVFRSPAFDTMISCVGIILFLGITAYDIQRIKNQANYIYDQNPNGEIDDVVHRASLFGALMLYLDFINLFLKLLRLFGKKK